MSSLKTPSSKDIWTVLRKSVFDPRTPGPLAIIVETGADDYLMARAREMIHEAEITNNAKEAIKLVTMAVSLLAIAQVKMGAVEVPSATKTRKKSKDNQQQHKGDDEGVPQNREDRQYNTNI